MGVIEKARLKLRDFLLPDLPGIIDRVAELEIKVDRFDRDFVTQISEVAGRFEARMGAFQTKMDARFDAFDQLQAARWAEIEERLSVLRLLPGSQVLALPIPHSQLLSQPIPLPESLLADLDARISALEARAEARDREIKISAPAKLPIQ